MVLQPCALWGGVQSVHSHLRQLRGRRRSRCTCASDPVLMLLHRPYPELQRYLGRAGKPAWLSPNPDWAFGLQSRFSASTNLERQDLSTKLVEVSTRTFGNQVTYIVLADGDQVRFAHTDCTHSLDIRHGRITHDFAVDVSDSRAPVHLVRHTSSIDVEILLLDQDAIAEHTRLSLTRRKGGDIADGKHWYEAKKFSSSR